MNPSDELCCVCEQQAARRLGTRAYCEEHYARAVRPNAGLIRTLAVLIGALVIFSAVVWLIGEYALQSPLPREVLYLLGLVLALVPAVIWLWFFYQQDRLEPEPRRYVGAVFLLALLLTDVVATRVFSAFELDKWLTVSDLALALGSVLVRGVVYSLIGWAVVRYTVYPTAEFDERMDGIVYGTAAGLGIATMLNLAYVIDNNGVLLGPGVVNIVMTALAQASFGGLIGYFLGEAKFIDEPVWWLPAGVTLASVLNGLFLWMSVKVRGAGFDVAAINALLLATVVAVLTFAVLIYLMRRAIARTLASQATSA